MLLPLWRRREEAGYVEDDGAEELSGVAMKYSLIVEDLVGCVGYVCYSKDGAFYWSPYSRGMVLQGQVRLGGQPEDLRYTPQQHVPLNYLVVP